MSLRWTFSLRTFLLVVAAIGLWLGYYVNWANDRKAVYFQEGIGTCTHYKANSLTEHKLPTPAFWSFLGFEYYDEVVLSRELFTVEDLQRIQKMFPEADVHFQILPVICPACKMVYTSEDEQFRSRETFECLECDTLIYMPKLERYKP